MIGASVCPIEIARKEQFEPKAWKTTDPLRVGTLVLFEIGSDYHVWLVLCLCFPLLAQPLSKFCKTTTFYPKPAHS